MINRKIKVVFLALGMGLFSIPNTVFAQSGSILESFTANVSNGKVFLTWVISMGYTCNGIQIYRSVDLENFQMVGEIPGICGAPDISAQFDFVDYSPENNRINHYKLELGNRGPSEIIPVNVLDIAEGEFQIRPNPADEFAVIYFNNPQFENSAIELLDLGGRLVMSSESSADNFNLELGTVPPGIYVFRVYGKQHNLITQGKLIVNH